MLIRFVEIMDRTRGVILFVLPDFRNQLIPTDPDDSMFADYDITAGADFVIRPFAKS